MDNIMSNLYGSTATQMLGGSEVSYERVAYPEYIQNKDFKTFIDEFYQIKRVVHSYSASIYIIPPTASLKSMVADFKKQLAKEKIEERSEEAFKYASVTALPFKRCIFNVFADSNSKSYKLDAKEEPAYRDFGTVKRTNLFNEQFWFRYKSDTQILICPHEKDDKGATTVKLIAKCNDGIYVFQGELPKAEKMFERKVNGKNNKAMTGGKKKSVCHCGKCPACKKRSKKIKKEKKQLLIKFLERYGEQGAERFFASCALCAKEHNHSMDVYNKCFSGDLLHSAFRVVFNSDAVDIPLMDDYSTKEIRTMTNELCKNFSPIKKSYKQDEMQKWYQKIYNTVAAKNMSAKQASNTYKHLLIQKLGKFGLDMLEADIATSLFRNSYQDDVNQIFNITDGIEEEGVDGDNEIANELKDSSHLEYEDDSLNVFATSKFNAIVNDALTSAPLVGLNAKSYYPNLQALDVRGMMGGEIDSSDDDNDFYDNDDNDDSTNNASDLDTDNDAQENDDQLFDDML